MRWLLESLNSSACAAETSISSDNATCKTDFVTKFISNRPPQNFLQCLVLAYGWKIVVQRSTKNYKVMPTCRCDSASDCIRRSDPVHDLFEMRWPLFAFEE